MALSDIEHILKDISNLWGLLQNDPKVIITSVLKILEEIRSINEKVNRTLRDEIYSVELSALHLLCFAYLKSDNLHHAKEAAIELGEKAKLNENKEYCALTDHVIAKTQMISGDLLSAKQLLVSVLSTLEKVYNYEYIQYVLIDLASIELDQNNYENSIELLLRAESEYQLHPINPRVSSIIMSNMSTVYMLLEKYDKALEYINLTLTNYKFANDVSNYTNTLLRLSFIYSKQGELTKQIETLQESVNTLNAQKQNRRLAIQRIALGTAYLENSDFSKSLVEFRLALNAPELESDKKNIAILHHRLGLLYSHELFEYRNVETAQYHFNKAEQIAIEISMPHFQAAVVESRARTFAAFGLFEQGFHQLDRSNTLEKQIINEKSLQQIHDLEVRYEVALKEKEIQLLDADKKVLELERTQLQAQLSMNNQYLFMYKKELNDFKTEILTITKQLDKAEIIVHKVKTKLRESLGVQDKWESYMEIFSKVHPEFKEKLIEMYPTLTEMEIRVCVLIRAGLISTEIAEILSLSYRTIENKRLIIRHKLSLKDKVKLDVFLADI